MMTMPETTSPLPSRSATPLRISGPSTTSPMSLMRIGVPESLAETDDVLEVLNGREIAAAPDHVLGPAELDQPARRLVVAAAHRLDHPVDGDAVGLQPVRVHVHLVLLPEPADGRHLGHTGHGLQVVSEIPVLVGAQVGQAVLSGFIHQRVLEDPAQGRGIRPQLGPHALRAGGAAPRRGIPGCGTGPSRCPCRPRR